MAQGDEVVILHFNDVYHTSDPSLLARFSTVLRDPRHVVGDGVWDSERSLRVFSGDAFSPSLEASVLHGDHMIDVLNLLNIDVACYGNHDFDFGEARLLDLSRRTNFPWTLANVVRNPPAEKHDRLLAQAREYVIKEVAGYKIGFFGLAGTDWPSNCQHLPSCDIQEPTEIARRVSSHLRRAEKCDLVVAVTHMRLAEDMSVSLGTMSGDERVDLILGGHDHHVLQRTATDTNSSPAVIQQGIANSDAAYTTFEGPVRIIKSGTDWRGLSVARLTVERRPDQSVFISGVSLLQVSDLERMPDYHRIPPCQDMLSAIAKTQTSIETLVQQPLFYADVPLQGLSATVRGEESNLGNMLADAIRAFYDTDIAFMNGGSIRCDRILQSQETTPLRIRDLIDICPFGCPLVVRRISGRTLATALENSVSDAHADGRFLHPSGLGFSVDWNRREGERVLDTQYLPSSALQPQALDYDRIYTVAMPNFIALGFDGYSCFETTETLVDAEGAMTDTNLMLEIFDGTFTPQDDANCRVDDETTAGILRARAAIIKSRSETDGLPVVKPRCEGRIKVTGGSGL